MQSQGTPLDRSAAYVAGVCASPACPRAVYGNYAFAANVKAAPWTGPMRSCAIAEQVTHHKRIT
jgi:hypothetical protein